MDLSELKRQLDHIEASLKSSPIIDLGNFETPVGEITVAITGRFRKRCRRGRVWKSNSMLTALKNVQYGFDPRHSRSRGGADGVFLIDRNWRPPNEMMRKMFDRFLDKPDPLVAVLVERFGVPAGQLIPVRVVSHHLRLLGVLIKREIGANLALVDYDDTKNG